MCCVYYVKKPALGAALLALALCFSGCPEMDAPSGANDITGFSVGGTQGTVDQTNQTVLVILPVSQTDFTVRVSVSSGARASLKAAENARGVAVWAVTAESGAQKDYAVTTVKLGGGAFELTLPNRNSGITIVSIGDHWPDGLNQQGMTGQAAVGTNVVDVEASDSTFDDYKWFVDGEPYYPYATDKGISFRTHRITLTAGSYGLGAHRLTLIATRNGVPYTAEVEFTRI